MNYPTREQSSLSSEREATTGVVVRPNQDQRQRRDLDTSGRRDATYALARTLGWFSIGLGLTEVLMPRKLGRAIGVGDDHSALLPLLGLREIASGIGVLAARDPAAGVRARIVGDAVDLALLGRALASPENQRGRVAAATAAIVGVTALDVLCAARLTAQTRQQTSKAGHAFTSLTINLPASELYTYWRNFENLPRVMRHLEAVRETGDRRSHWVAKGPGGVTAEWEAEITQETPDERLAWRSLPDSDVPTQGYVEFKSLAGNRGTLVTVDIEYQPSGAAAATISKLFGAALEQQLQNDLRRWKQLMETGEVATTEGQPSGRRSLLSRHLP